jgi:steroid delta-isomerase-like uncharacterized protein
MSNSIKEITRRLNKEVWNQGKLSTIDELVSSDFVNHSPAPGLPADREGFKQFVMMYRNAFPDVKITIEDIVAEGDRVMIRWSATGTHKGEIMGVEPTNKEVDVTGMSENRISNGKVVEQWNEFDVMGMMQQIGAIPQPELG